MTLSLDQSLSSSGFIVWSQEGSIEKFGALKKPKTLDDPVHQLKWVIANIESLLKENKITLVVMEGLPFGMQSASVRVLAALFFMVLIVCDTLNIEVVVIPPTEVKKAAGSGKFKKHEVIQALPEEFTSKVLAAGYKKTTGLSDIADAFFLYKAHKIREAKIQA